MSKNIFTSSLKELENPRTLTLCALLIAVHIILNMASFYVLGVIKVTFSYVALAVIAMLFGPVTAFFCGGVAEIVGYLLNSVGAYHPGFTITTMLTGFVMGLFLYRRELTLWRVILSRTLVNLFLNIGLNTVWVMQTLGKAYIALLPGRLWKNLVLLPVEICLIYFTLKLSQRLKLNKR